MFIRDWLGITRLFLRFRYLSTLAFASRWHYLFNDALKATVDLFSDLLFFSVRGYSSCV